MMNAGKKARGLRLSYKTTRKVANRTGAAREVLGPLHECVRVTGLTAGQFSAIDALEHMANELGPADVRISTWTTGIYDITRAAKLRANGNLRDVKFLLDRGSFERSPQFAGPLIAALGPEAFRCMLVHAKVIIVHGERGSAAFRSSMNLNKNLRTEQFDIDVSTEVADFYAAWFDALWEESGRSNDNVAIMKAVFERFESGEGQTPASTALDEVEALDLGEGFLLEDRPVPA